MEFTFTPEQRLMASTFRKLADDLHTDAAGDAWRRMVEWGLPAMLAPESAGGLGLVDADFVLVAEEAGCAALAEPLIEHAGIAAPMLADLARLTFRDPTGSTPADPVRPSLADRAGYAPADGAGQALAAQVLTRAASGAARIAIGHPVNPYVLGGARADYLLLASGDEVHLVEARHARLTRVESIDKGRELVKVESPASQTTRIAAGTAAREAYRCALERGALYSAAQLVGLCQRMIDLSVAYARQRRQFGKPIGSYQAIQHALASVQVKLEFARPVLYYAATRVCDPGLRAQAAVSHAKVAATDAADLAARTAMQVHGAMGYSWEVDLHVYMKRAWALAGAWGDRSFHARHVSSLVLEGHIEIGPECTFD